MDEQNLTGKTFLVVDDEADLRDIVASELEFLGGKTFQSENIFDAQKILDSQKIDLIISDIRMPGGTGIDLLKLVKSNHVRFPPVILITGFADVSLEDAYDMGAESLMSKPFKLDDLVRTVARFTDSLEDRLSNQVPAGIKVLQHQFPETLEKSMANQAFLLGRGGFSMSYELNGQRFQLGESVRFELKFQDQTLSGTSLCRWFKNKDNFSRLVNIGMEYVQLSDPTLKFFLDFCREQNPRAFIPALH